MLNNVSFGSAFVQAGTLKTKPVYVNRDDVAGISPAGNGTDICLKGVHIAGGGDNVCTQKAVLHVEENTSDVAAYLHLNA